MLNFRMDNFYLFEYVKDTFIIIDFETLGEIYQEEQDKNIESYINENDETKLEMFESFKSDCIYFDSKEDWQEFYNKYRTKYNTNQEDLKD